MKSRKNLTIIGIILLVFLGISYFIKIDIDSGSNYIVKDSLLGIIIFHSWIVLLIYIALCLALMWFGIRKKIWNLT